MITFENRNDDMDEGTLTHIAEHAFSRVKQMGFVNVTVLNFNRNRLQVLSLESFRGLDIETLILSNNQLQGISPLHLKGERSKKNSNCSLTHSPVHSVTQALRHSGTHDVSCAYRSRKFATPYHPE